MHRVNKVRHEDLVSYLPDRIDAFLCSASFETRCLSVPLVLPPTAVRHVFVFENEEDVGGLKLNARRIKEHFGAPAKRIELYLEDPIKVADALYRAVAREAESLHHVLIDITTFTRETLLILLQILRELLKPNSRILLAYTSAREYALGLEEDEKWLAKGIRDIRSVLGYPGYMIPTRKYHLIVMVGFEHERATKLIETYQPSSLSLGFGAEGVSISDHHQRINAEFHRKLVNLYGPVRSFNFSCIDPDEARQALEEQIVLLPNHNVVVAPLNTKISVIGAALCVLKRPETQLCYATATAYNIDGYSEPGPDCYLFELPNLLPNSG